MRSSLNLPTVAITLLFFASPSFQHPSPSAPELSSSPPSPSTRQLHLVAPASSRATDVVRKALRQFDARLGRLNRVQPMQQFLLNDGHMKQMFDLRGAIGNLVGMPLMDRGRNSKRSDGLMSLRQQYQVERSHMNSLLGSILDLVTLPDHLMLSGQHDKKSTPISFTRLRRAMLGGLATDEGEEDDDGEAEGDLFL